jgi:sucrose phosphorylase
MSLQNKCQLIVYPDSLGNNLPELHYILNKYLKKSIGGVHILPFYPSFSDRGFCPTDYNMVDLQFGHWDDIEKIAQEYDLIVDFIPNHISRNSIFFQEYIKKGKASKYYDLFLQISKLWPKGRIPTSELQNIDLRKPESPELMVELGDGTREYVWQTFESPEQIDLDIHSLVYKKLFGDFLLTILHSGVKMVRLDAIGFVTKKPGTSCYFIEPEIWNFLSWIKNFTDTYRVEILPEIHGDYDYQKKLSSKGYWVYDFVLPLLTAYTILQQDSFSIQKWLKECPRKQITTLDTHDGVPVVDCKGFLSEEQIATTYQKMVNQNGGVINYGYSIAGNKEVYQIDGSYFSLIGENEDAYLVARAIQIFAPGIPQIYYNGLLAGKNDEEHLAKTEGQKIGGWSRDLNRRNYTAAECKKEFEKPIVKRILALMELRNTAPAFEGELEVVETDKTTLSLIWKKDTFIAKAHINLISYICDVEFTLENGETRKFRA